MEGDATTITIRCLCIYMSQWKRCVTSGIRVVVASIDSTLTTEHLHDMPSTNFGGTAWAIDLAECGHNHRQIDVLPRRMYSLAVAIAPPKRVAEPHRNLEDRPAAGTKKAAAPGGSAHPWLALTSQSPHQEKFACPTPSHNSNPSFHGCAIGRKTVGVLLRGRERKTIHGEWNNPQQAACAEPRLNIHVVYLADDEERKRGTEPRKVL
jgi:hypothetical protein